MSWLGATASRPFGPSARPRRYGASSRRSALSLSAVLAILLLAAVWAFFAPTLIGGPASYVIINGNSMEPGYHRGDLVITRTAERYHVGDIVAYRDPTLGPVIHRIVEEKDDHFVLQGDNNSWLDSYQPTQSEIIGKSFIYIPSIGKLLEWMRSPMGLAIMVVVVGGIGLMTFNTAKEEDKQPRGLRARVSPKGGGGSARRPSGQSEQGVINLLALVMILSLLLGGFAFSRAASSKTSEDVPYENKGEFSYWAAVPPGVYDTRSLVTGEPVFFRLTKGVEVQFDYKLDSAVPTDGVEGTYQLIAQISDANGWKRSITIEPTTSFTGGEFTAQGTLSLSAIEGIIDEFEKKTGYTTGRYAVSVIPEVSMGGTLAGLELDDSFSPRLDFWFDKTQLQLQNPDAGAAAASGEGNAAMDEEGADQLEPSEAASVKLTKTVPNSMSILGFGLDVWTARIISVLGVALSLGGLVWFGQPILRARKAGEPTRIRAQYGEMLVSMNGGNLESDGRVIEVTAFQDLVKIAEKSGQSILHRMSDGIDHYYVQDLGVSYHYWAVDQEEEEEEEEANGDKSEKGNLTTGAREA